MLTTSQRFITVSDQQLKEIKLAMTTLAVFEFNTQEVRIIDRGGEPWFVAKDLCEVLDIQNIRQNLAKLDDDEKGVCSVYTPGGKQEMVTVSESGMYALVLTSRKPEAKPFRKWVTSEVLPTIRKQGSYSVTPAELKLPPADVRINELRQSMQFFDIDVSNPRYKQAIQDLVLNKIIGANAFPSGEQEVWRGVAERAEELGYPVRLVTKYRSTLGKFVKVFDLESRQEKRLCNGTQREISLYKVTGELDSAIKEYMDAKTLAS